MTRVEDGEPQSEAAKIAAHIEEFKRYRQASADIENDQNLSDEEKQDLIEVNHRKMMQMWGERTEEEKKRDAQIVAQIAQLKLVAQMRRQYEAQAATGADQQMLEVGLVFC